MGKEARSHVRGSSLLFAGRVLEVLLNLVSQVLVVRALTKEDFGAFSFALALVAIGTNLNLFGMHRSVPRFVPLFEEREDSRRALGTITGASWIVALFGLALVLLTVGTRGLWDGALVEDPRASQILLVVVLLLPIQSLDAVLQSLAAVFLGARAIFLRRHVLAPLARLLAVLTVLAMEGTALALAWGYVASGLLGVVIYGPLLRNALRDAGYLELWSWRPRHAPWRDLFGFGAPLLFLDVALVLKAQLAIVLLQALSGSAEVAGYRAVVSPAALVLIASQSFKHLYLPAATRLYARQEWEALATVYWSAARWVMLLSFPVLAVCVAIPEEISTWLFGTRYAGSADVLSVLALGNFLGLALGMSANTLHVHGRLRAQVVGNVFVLALGAALCFHLIPRHGGLGAAFATASMLGAQALVDFTLLRRSTPIARMPRTALRLLGTIGLACALLLVVRRADLHFALATLAAALASLAVLVLASRDLDIDGTFPELARVPLLSTLVRSAR